MAISSSGALIDVVRLHKLLRADQLSQLPHLAHGRCGDARNLIRLLVRRGWFTIYQANQILEGKAANLTIGPYHVLDSLGQGGLSQVFKARHIEYDWIVALKVLRPEAIENAAGRSQFLQEIEAMALLDHPNIVQFCDVDQAGNTFYFAMEFVDGVDLGKRVGLTGPLPVREACEYIRQAGLGLQHAHECNLVHRDIKPMNLFLTQAPIVELGKMQQGRNAPKCPQIKILDWGLAARRCPNARKVPATEPATKPTGIVGTADYLAPEQARDPNSVDIRGDIYSLGCSLYFLLTGQPPFPDGHLAQKLMAHQTAEPAPVDEFRNNVPLEVLQILRRMMAKTPTERFQTPAAAALALRPFGRPERKKPSEALTSKNRRSTEPRNDHTPLPETLRQSRRTSKEGSATNFSS